MRDNPKVPEIEQMLAAGAAVQNLWLAAHALGYGVMWKTGPAAYDAAVKAAVGLQPEDHIVAIMHLGTRAEGDDGGPARKTVRAARPISPAPTPASPAAARDRAVAALVIRAISSRRRCRS